MAQFDCKFWRYIAIDKGGQSYQPRQVHQRAQTHGIRSRDRTSTIRRWHLVPQYNADITIQLAGTGNSADKSTRSRMEKLQHLGPCRIRAVKFLAKPDGSFHSELSYDPTDRIRCHALTYTVPALTFHRPFDGSFPPQRDVRDRLSGRPKRSVRKRPIADIEVTG
jgi:hypothetical protein